MMLKGNSKYFLFGFWMCLCLLFYGCVSTGHPPLEKMENLSSQEAASLASLLANKQCLEIFGESPFSPGMYAMDLRNNMWQWGSLERVNTKGFSAQVSFALDGSNANVEVFFNEDQVNFQMSNEEKYIR